MMKINRNKATMYSKEMTHTSSKHLLYLRKMYCSS